MILLSHFYLNCVSEMKFLQVFIAYESILFKLPTLFLMKVHELGAVLKWRYRFIATHKKVIITYVSRKYCRLKIVYRLFGYVQFTLR